MTLWALLDPVLNNQPGRFLCAGDDSFGKRTVTLAELDKKKRNLTGTLMRLSA